VTDEYGYILGAGRARAQGDWMTEDFVPFTATVTFDPGYETYGYIVLERDNPSGLPEYDDALWLPVRFE
jgi:hypothetical protein